MRPPVAVCLRWCVSGVQGALRGRASPPAEAALVAVAPPLTARLLCGQCFCTVVGAAQVNALLAHACLGLDCHEFSSAPASRESPPPETHAGTALGGGPVPPSEAVPFCQPQRGK